MASSFGVTVLPDPPHQRLVELLALAESHGFEYGWTNHSHLLWQESFPLLTLAAQATTTMKLGHCVTNPGTREPTVLAEWLRDAARHLERPHGDGHRAGRLGTAHDRPAARQGRRVRAALRDGQGVHERAGGRLEREELQLKWVRPELPEIPMWVAGYGPKALAVAGRVGDGVIIQLADPAIVRVDHGPRPAKAAEEAGRDPGALQCIVCAPSHISDDMADAREQVRWFPAMVSNHVMDLIERATGFDSEIPKELTESFGAASSTTTRSTHVLARSTASS